MLRASLGLAAHIGLLHCVGIVVALVFGLIAGGISADALASRRWDQPMTKTKAPTQTP